MENIATRATGDHPDASPHSIVDPFAQVDAHIEAIKPAHQAAWSFPVVRDYEPGSLVWMWDHYNTARVIGPSVKREDHWSIVTTDADGSESSYEYPSGQLRPATAPVEFRWSVSRPAPSSTGGAS